MEKSKDPTLGREDSKWNWKGGLLSDTDSDGKAVARALPSVASEGEACLAKLKEGPGDTASAGGSDENGNEGAKRGVFWEWGAVFAVFVLRGVAYVRPGGALGVMAVVPRGDRSRPGRGVSHMLHAPAASRFSNVQLAQAHSGGCWAAGGVGRPCSIISSRCGQTVSM